MSKIKMIEIERENTLHVLDTYAYVCMYVCMHHISIPSLLKLNQSIKPSQLAKD